MIVKAPWTEEQVKCLHKRQKDVTKHPYTCGKSSSHGLLIPSQNGWSCPDCDYKQNWCFVDVMGQI